MLKRGLLVVLIALVALPLATLQAQGPGEVLYEEDFSSPKTGWNVGEYDGGAVGYTDDGTYFVISNGNSTMEWGAAGQDFSDATIAVDATQISASDNNNNGYGVMCRVQDDGYGYLLRISGDGYASIYLVTEEFTALSEWTQVDAVIQGDSTNHLEATCDGSTLSLVVNGVSVATAEDDTYASGDIALSATSYEATASEIHFDDLSVTATGTAPGNTPDAPIGPVDTQGLLVDDFSDDGSGWEIGVYDSGSSGYANGYYYVTAEAAGILEFGAAQRNFTDVVIAVETTQFSGPANDNNGYGVICRAQSNGDGYLLRISGDGYASIVLGANDEFTSLVEWTPTEAVNQGNATNQLQACCVGTHLSLTVNGELVLEADDDTFGSGDIAMTASTYEDEPTEIHFDNVFATAPESAPGLLGTPVPSKDSQPGG